MRRDAQMPGDPEAVNRLGESPSTGSTSSPQASSGQAEAPQSISPIGEQGELFHVEGTDEELGLDAYEAGRALTSRENAFVRFYTGKQYFLNQTASAKAAGYSWPWVNGSRLMARDNVRQAIRKEMDSILDDPRLSKEALVAILADWALLDPLDIQDEEGNYKPLSEWPVNARRAIDAFGKRTVETELKDGSVVRDTSESYKVVPRKEAMALLTKILEYVTDKVDHTSGGKAIAGMPVEIRVIREAVCIPGMGGPEEIEERGVTPEETPGAE